MNKKFLTAPALAAVLGIGALAASGGESEVQAADAARISALAPATSRPDLSALPTGAREAATRGEISPAITNPTSVTPKATIDGIGTQVFANGSELCLSIDLPGDLGSIACGPRSGLEKTGNTAPLTVSDGNGGWIIAGITGDATKSVALNGRQVLARNNTFALRTAKAGGSLQVTDTDGKTRTVALLPAENLPPATADQVKSAN